MKIKTNVTLGAMLLLCLNSNAQSTATKQVAAPKQLVAKRVSSPIKLDGLIDDAAWKDAPAALGYTEYRPTPFRAEDPANRTEAYILYDNEGSIRV